MHVGAEVAKVNRLDENLAGARQVGEGQNLNQAGQDQRQDRQEDMPVGPVRRVEIAQQAGAKKKEQIGGG